MLSVTNDVHEVGRKPPEFGSCAGNLSTVHIIFFTRYNSPHNLNLILHRRKAGLYFSKNYVLVVELAKTLLQC